MCVQQQQMDGCCVPAVLILEGHTAGVLLHVAWLLLTTPLLSLLCHPPAMPMFFLGSLGTSKLLAALRPRHTSSLCLACIPLHPLRHLYKRTTSLPPGSPSGHHTGSISLLDPTSSHCILTLAFLAIVVSSCYFSVRHSALPLDSITATRSKMGVPSTSLQTDPYPNKHQSLGT